MAGMSRSSIAKGLLFICLLFLMGCASSLTTVAPRPPENYERLGHATGTATGSLVIFLEPLHFIPMRLNSRVERAYENALKSVPGATGLVDVTYQESWYWWVIGTARKVTISGEAIREIKQ